MSFHNPSDHDYPRGTLIHIHPMSHQNTNMEYRSQLAQGPSEEFILRQLALSMAIESGRGTSAKHIVEIAETFYEFLSTEKEKP